MRHCLIGAVLPLLAACVPPDASTTTARSSPAPAVVAPPPAPPDGAVLAERCRQQAERSAAGMPGRRLYNHQVSTRAPAGIWHATVSIRYVDDGTPIRGGFYVCEFRGDALTDFQPQPDPPQRR